MSGDITPYTSLITSEHNQKPNFMAVVATAVEPVADQILVSEGVPTLFDLDTAVGQQLDYVGQWIGVTRNLEIALTGVYFSFDTFGLGFDQGAWAPVDGSTVLTSLPDDQYRLLLYAKVAENHWDGTVPSALELLNAFWNPQGYYIYIIDGQDMTMSYILVGPTPTPITLALYTNGLLDLRPAGVLVANHYYLEGSGGIPLYPIFGFDQSNFFIQGFDDGYWDGQGTTIALTARLRGVGRLSERNWSADFSARGLLLAGPIVFPIPDGTFSIITLGNDDVSTNKFTYSGAVVTAATSMLSGVDAGGAAGTNTAGYFALGGNGASMNIYTFSGDAVTAGTSLTGNVYVNGAAAGNAVVGIFSHGFGAAGACDMVTYSGDIVAATTSLTGQLHNGMAAGNSTEAIFALGNSAASTNKFTYSGAVVVSATSLTDAVAAGAAVGNGTEGIFVLGYAATDIKATCKYHYAGDTVASGTDTTSDMEYGSASGISTFGLIVIGHSSSLTNLYTYAGDSVAASTALTNATTYGSAVSNGCYGVNT